MTILRRLCHGLDTIKKEYQPGNRKTSLMNKEYYSPASLFEVLEKLAKSRPDDVSHSYYRDAGAIEATWTYRELHERVSRLAENLSENLSPGDRALLLYTSPLECLAAFLGCLKARVIAVPAPPPEPSRLKRSLPRLSAIIEDCGARLILCDTAISDLLLQNQDKTAGLSTLGKLVSSEAGAEIIGHLPEVATAASPGDLERTAYLQYSSGSTGIPKGIMISETALLANLAHNKQLWRYDEASVSVNWMPYYHDYGLVEGLLQPLYSGIPAHLLSPTSFLRAPGRWLTLISKNRATHAAAPNFGYDYCVTRIKDKEAGSLDLSSWRVASNGAEMVRSDTLDRFAEKFAAAGFKKSAFMPSYGLAEATLLVAAKSWEDTDATVRADSEDLTVGRYSPARMDGPAATIVSCGRGGPGTEIAIVKIGTTEKCEAGEIGEILVRAPGLAHGYWGREDETAEIFDTQVAGKKDASQNGGYLRTGDLGFMVGDALFVTGRQKDLIIVRGNNYFPHDLEATVRDAHQDLAAVECAAFGYGAPEQLGLAIEVDNGLEPDGRQEIFEHLRTAIYDIYNIQLAALVFLRRGGLPKTSSGKVQRSICAEKTMNGPFDKEIDRLPSVPVEDAPQSAATSDRIVRDLRAYARDRMNLTLMDERRAMMPNVVLDFGNMGMLGLISPTGQGGQGLDATGLAKVLEQLGGIDLSLGVFTILQNGLGLYPLIRFGREDQKDRLLPHLSTGRALISFAYTEEVAGSNIRAIGTTAHRTGDGGITLNGTKIWSGSSAWAENIIVFARESDGDGTPLGISAFIVDRSMPGLRTDGEAATMGLRTTIQNKVILDGVRVDDSHRLGGAGDGLAVAEAAMGYTRFCLAALCLGALKRAVRVLHTYAASRTVNTGRLIDHPLVRAKLSHWSAAATGLAALIKRTAEAEENASDGRADLQAVCKALAPEFLWQAADDCMQLAGGRGYMETNLIPMIFRDARAIRIFEGPTEAIFHHLGSKVMNTSAEFEGILRSLTASDSTAKEVQNLKDTIASTHSESAYPFADNGGSRARQAQGLGEYAAWCLLEAVIAEDIKTATDDRQGENLERARAWCGANKDEVYRKALALSPGEMAGLDESGITEFLRTIDSDIGPADYNPPELLTEMDAALIPDGTPNEETAKPRAAPAPRPAKPEIASENTRAEPHELMSWISKWIEKTMTLAPNSVDPDKPFAVFGLDSVTASMLAMDLEGRIGRPVDPTLVWDYPNIRKLSDYLARGPQPGAASAAPAETPQMSKAEELESLLKDIDLD